MFRFFDIANEDIEEIASLSQQAYETLEATDDYSPEPQALFSQADRSLERGRMLLPT